MKLRCLVYLLTAVTAVARPGLGLPETENSAHPGQAATGELAGETLIAEEAQAPDKSATGEAAENELAETLIPESFLRDYFGVRPEKFLIDPQNLLGPVEYRERLAFLNYHAGDSAIDLFVHVIGGDQSIPREVRQEEVMERFFSSGRPAVVVYYFMGAPQRTVLHLSPTLAAAVPAAEQRRALESSVILALKEIEPARQLEAFLMQISIRIYWMERMMGGDAPDKAPAPAVVPVAKLEENSGLRDFVQPHLEKVAAHVLPASLVAMALSLGWAARFWLKRRARHHFPDFEVEPRLGGAHAAGVGAVISFASATVPPASQRDAMPDYLRRA